VKAGYLESPRNVLIKEYVKLQRSRRHRQKEGKIALEGPNLIRAAIQAGLIPEMLFFTRDYADGPGKDWLSRLPAASRQYILSEAAFKSIADTESPQAVAAVVPFRIEKQAGLKDAFVPQLSLILDRLQDPGNMGTIIRTAAAAGVERIYYISGSADPYSPKVLRATAGAIFEISMEPADDSGCLASALKGKGVQLVAGSSGSATCYWSADYCPPTALIIGNEAGGISPVLKAAADISVSIPLAGSVDSLNAAVASGIILYEIIRQRNAGIT
jgi:RNA methyltransferase, TrmH family